MVYGVYVVGVRVVVGWVGRMSRVGELLYNECRVIVWVATEVAE